MDTDITTTVAAARTRVTWAPCVVPSQFGGAPSILGSGASVVVMGAVAHFGGEAVVNDGSTKPSTDDDTRSGTGWSPPV